MTKNGKLLFDREEELWLENRRKEIEKIKKMGKREAIEYVKKNHPNWAIGYNGGE